MSVDPDTMHPRAIEMAEAMREGVTTFRDLIGRGFAPTEIGRFHEEARALAICRVERQGTALPTRQTIGVPSFRRDGTVMNLAAPQVSDIDFAEMAAGLSKIARFNGRNPQAAYSDAQHSVFCADALFAETGDAVLAGCGLLHDGHEYLIGDLTRPFASLIAINVAAVLRDGGFAPDIAERASAAVAEAIRAAKSAIDDAVFAAAGVGYPRLYPAYVRQVHDMDERMLRAEGLALFGRKAGAHLPAARRPAPKLTSPIEPWGAAKAEMAFIDRLERYLGIVVRPA